MIRTWQLREDRTVLIDQTIDLWITTKTEASQSQRTKEAYEQAITSFRAMTLQAGIDLDGFAPGISMQHITSDDMEQALYNGTKKLDRWMRDNSRKERDISKEETHGKFTEEVQQRFQREGGIGSNKRSENDQ